MYTGPACVLAAGLCGMWLTKQIENILGCSFQSIKFIVSGKFCVITKEGHRQEYEISLEQIRQLHELYEAWHNLQKALGRKKL